MKFFSSLVGIATLSSLGGVGMYAWSKFKDTDEPSGDAPTYLLIQKIDITTERTLTEEQKNTNDKNYYCKAENGSDKDSECELFSIALDSTTKTVDLSTIPSNKKSIQNYFDVINSETTRASTYTNYFYILSTKQDYLSTDDETLKSLFIKNDQDTENTNGIKFAILGTFKDKWEFTGNNTAFTTKLTETPDEKISINNKSLTCQIKGYPGQHKCQVQKIEQEQQDLSKINFSSLDSVLPTNTNETVEISKSEIGSFYLMGFNNESSEFPLNDFKNKEITINSNENEPQKSATFTIESLFFHVPGEYVMINSTNQ